MNFLQALYDLYTNPDNRGLGIGPRERIANHDAVTMLWAVGLNQATFREWKQLALSVVNRTWSLEGSEITLGEALDGLTQDAQSGMTFDQICKSWDLDGNAVKRLAKLW